MLRSSLCPSFLAVLVSQLEVVPIKEARSLDLSFPMCPIKDLYKSKPASYISHLVGHESAGSIISYLKKKNWANDLWGGPSRSCSDWASFQIGVDLTEEVSFTEVANQ